MIAFIFIILVWASFGVMMILTMDKPGKNWYGLIFLGIVPLIPFIAKIFGIL